MHPAAAIIATFDDHVSAETAVKQLAAAGFAMNSLSVVGKGYHEDENVVGFYNGGERVHFWGRLGMFWGSLFGMFLAVLFVPVSLAGPVMILGYLAETGVAALEGAILVGGASALSAALFSLGVPQDSIIQYETEVASNGFLVMAHGNHNEIDRAKMILEAAGAKRVEAHSRPAAAAIAAPVSGDLAVA